jgi:hypothetical protein
MMDTTSQEVPTKRDHLLTVRARAPSLAQASAIEWGQLRHHALRVLKSPGSWGRSGQNGGPRKRTGGTATEEAKACCTMR